jgi:cytochrome c-type biogenesis protein CcmF
VLAATLVLAPGIGILPLLGLALSAGLAIASVMPLVGRNLRRTPLPVWGMVAAHLGLAVAVAGMASESAFSTERLVAATVGDSVEAGPWTVSLSAIDPVAGPNWTALQADMQASYRGGEPITLHPQSRTFTSPVQTTSESALATRWNGQLYAVLGVQGDDGRWQLRLWWKPFVPLIWLGGLLVALGGALALVGRIASGWRRQISMRRIAERREANPLPQERAGA